VGEPDGGGIWTPQKRGDIISKNLKELVMFRKGSNRQGKRKRDKNYLGRAQSEVTQGTLILFVQRWSSGAQKKYERTKHNIQRKAHKRGKKKKKPVENTNTGKREERLLA